MAINPSLWTIPVEVELYAAYALITVLARRWKIKAGMVLLVTSVVSFAALGAYFVGWQVADVNFLKFWVIWWSGAWLAERWRSAELPPWRWTGVLSLIISTALIAIGAMKGWDHAVMHFAWGCLSFVILWGCLNSGLTWTAPAWRLLAKVGVFSYSLYLVHFPAFRVMGHFWRQWSGGDKPASFLVPVLASLLCLPLAWLFYLLIERPSHYLGKRLASVRPQSFKS